MLEFRGVGYWYGETRGIAGVTLSAHSGELIALAGSNGSGEIDALEDCRACAFAVDW